MEQFNAEKIVDDLRLGHKPDGELVVSFDNGCELKYGNELTPTQVQHKPNKIDWNVDPGTLYTLAFVDPDVPSRADPKLGEALHWLVVNISGKDITSGEEYAEYIGSGAPEDTGLHRYIYLVFKQSSKLTLNGPKISRFCLEGRLNFKIADFVKERQLEGPIAGNFYQAQFDDYVPLLHAQLAKGN